MQLTERCCRLSHAVNNALMDHRDRPALAQLSPVAGLKPAAHPWPPAYLPLILAEALGWRFVLPGRGRSGPLRTIRMSPPNGCFHHDLTFAPSMPPVLRAA